MAKVKVIHDVMGESITVYFSEPHKNQICEETGEGVILIKNKETNEIIGFEKLYFTPDQANSLILEGQILGQEEKIY